ncbi:MAG: DUF503 domain-containing protein [Firmicutes bacterium]|nr:DUF503 domain-containing protein [Bacillota bacterium]
MVVGTAVVSLYVQDAQSLKDKRRVIKSLIDRVRHRFNASVAEVDDQDLWQSARLAIAVVGSDSSIVARQLQSITAFIEEQGPALVTGIDTELR